MTYEDYNHVEIDSICTELLEVHADKLKAEEIAFIHSMQAVNKLQKISYPDRDVLIGMYDRMRGED